MRKANHVLYINLQFISFKPQNTYKKMEVASRSEHKAVNQEHSFYWPAGGDSSSFKVVYKSMGECLCHALDYLVNIS